jgi:3-O-methylgallate 3,4-dioxygenase
MMQVRRLHEGQTVSHAFGFVWRRLMINKVIPIIPIHIKTHFRSNQPTPERCLELGCPVWRAVESWSSDARVAVLASGWFRHFLVDEEIDRQSMRAMDNKSMAVYYYVSCHRSLAGTGCAMGFATRE